MKEGDIVTIFEDPDTCQIVEGKAKLIEKLPSDNPPLLC